MLGNAEQRTEGMKKQAQELIDQAYQRGKSAAEFKAQEIHDKGYAAGIEQGRNEAWQTAKKIMSQNDASWGMKEMKEIFGSSYSTDILHDLSASEAIEKIRAYEEWKRQGEEIRVGDEVLFNGCAKSVVLRTGKRDLENYSFIMCSDGSGGKCENWKLKKTGRTFPEIVEVLKKMKEDEECQS